MKRYVNKSKIKQEVESASIEDLIADIWGCAKVNSDPVESDPLDLEDEEESLTMQYGWY